MSQILENEAYRNYLAEFRQAQNITFDDNNNRPKARAESLARFFLFLVGSAVPETVCSRIDAAFKILNSTSSSKSEFLNNLDDTTDQEEVRRHLLALLDAISYPKSSAITTRRLFAAISRLRPDLNPYGSLENTGKALGCTKQAIFTMGKKLVRRVVRHMKATSPAR